MSELSFFQPLTTRSRHLRVFYCHMENPTRIHMRSILKWIVTRFGPIVIEVLASGITIKGWRVSVYFDDSAKLYRIIITRE